MDEDKQNGQNSADGDSPIQKAIHVSGLYEHWFLDYASYVILERAVPAIEDGLKPVQRRIMHAIKVMDDGRFNKVANVIGNTMQYHPHGDASIGDAIIQLGQKDLLFDLQGNWGDIRTGDRAAAPRYIEVRLSKFALEIAYNSQITEWQLSYDSRKEEPVTLPVKFPLLLAQGVEGIAVGLSTKILPHNFIELLEASIAILKGKKPKMLPDFPTGGLADFSDYNEGKRGGKVHARARIEELDKKSLVIRDIPFGITTVGLIESVIRASDKGKIKIKKVVDNTAKDVEILVYLAPGQSPDVTIDALYAFTDCEVSISPNACVIVDDKPVFLGVNDILKINTNRTVNLLKRELEIRHGELLEKILFSSLEKIFIENRIYRDIEECETWESVIETIDRGLTPYKSQFYRDITRDDIVRLTEIKIKRISKFDTLKADEQLKNLHDELAQTEHHLANLVEYAINYFKHLLEKYGKGKERKTEIRAFDTIKAAVVAANNVKLYINREEGFIGYGMKKEEYLCDCSDIDDVIVFRQDGKMMVTRIAEKVFVGKHILYACIFKKSDERMVYNLVYLDAKKGRSMVKRFQVLGVTRDKEYDLTKGAKGSKVQYFTSNPNGEAETVTVYLSARSHARNKVIDFDFADIEIKGRGAGGNIITKHPVRKIQLKTEGKSTLGGVDIYYDSSIGRLNRDSRGRYLGNFKSDDLILVITKDGEYELTNFELINRYETEGMMLLEKFDPEKIVTAIYKEGKSKLSYVKRFHIETSTNDKKFLFISDSKNSQLQFVSVGNKLRIKADIKKKRLKEIIEFDLVGLIDVKGWKAIGNKLSAYPVVKIMDISEKQEDKADKSGEGIDLGDKVEAKEVKEQKPASKKNSGVTTGKTVKLPRKKIDSQKKEEMPASTKTVEKKSKKPADDKREATPPQDDAYHTGDTIELDLNKDKKDSDQLDLFD